MPIKGVRACGARCRTKNGEPCLGAAMKKGRCRIHGGVFYKRETPRGWTLRANQSTQTGMGSFERSEAAKFCGAIKKAG